MDASIDDKVKMIDDIYRDFLQKVKDIEDNRDKKIAELFKSDDQKKIARILKSIKKTV